MMAPRMEMVGMKKMNMRIDRWDIERSGRYSMSVEEIMSIRLNPIAGLPKRWCQPTVVESLS